MFDELDSIVLAQNIEKYGLKKGDIGTIVHMYDKKGIEVEFVTARGKTVAVVTLSTKDVRPLKNNDILHVRGVAAV